MAQIKKRAQKVSKGERRGAKKVHLSEMQKFMIGNGGVGHRYFRRKTK